MHPGQLYKHVRGRQPCHCPWYWTYLSRGKLLQVQPDPPECNSNYCNCWQSKQAACDLQKSFPSPERERINIFQPFAAAAVYFTAWHIHTHTFTFKQFPCRDTWLLLTLCKQTAGILTWTHIWKSQLLLPRTAVIDVACLLLGVFFYHVNTIIITAAGTVDQENVYSAEPQLVFTATSTVLCVLDGISLTL